MPESVNRRGSSGPTTGAIAASAVSRPSIAMGGGYSRAMPGGPASRPALRALPAVDALAAQVPAPRPVALAAARAVLDQRRAELLAGADGEADLAARARAWAERLERPSLPRGGPPTRRAPPPPPTS